MAALAVEIDAHRGARIANVHQDRPDRFRLALEARDGKQDLVIELAPDLPRAWLGARTPAPRQPSPLANRMRHFLKRAQLVRAFAVEGERALALVFRRGGAETTLWLELFGAHANLYVVDPEGTVVVTPRGAPAARRGASVGAQFSPSPPRAPETADAPLPAGQSASVLIQALARPSQRPAAESATPRIRRVLRRALKAATKRIAGLEAQTGQIADAAVWRAKGELLRASFHLLEAGRSAVTVTDFTTDPPSEVEIELDPRRDPGEQVGQYFKRAKKAERAAAHATAALPETRQAHAAIESVLAELESTAEEDLPSLLATLPDRVRLEAERTLQSGAKAKRQGPIERTPWRTFISKDGWTLRVGKSARDNDQLTLRGARPQDLFVHVRGAQGSHVIVTTPRGKTVPKETLLDAAELACMFSKRAEADRNEVDYVLRRHVRKARGAPAGQVILERARTLSIRRDDKRRARLRGAGAA